LGGGWLKIRERYALLWRVLALSSSIGWTRCLVWWSNRILVSRLSLIRSDAGVLIKTKKTSKGAAAQVDEAKLLAQKAHAEKIECDRQPNHS